MFWQLEHILNLLGDIENKWLLPEIRVIHAIVIFLK
jgi:hypothetical protein